MRTKWSVFLLAFACLLGAAGCTPAAGDTANLSTSTTSAANTTASGPDQTMEQAAGEDTSFAEGPPPITSDESTSIEPQVPPAPVPIQPADPPADDQPNDSPAHTPQQPVSYAVTHSYFFDGEGGREWGDPEADPPAPNNAGTPDDSITVAYNVADLAYSLQWGACCVYLVGDSYVTLGAFQCGYPIQCLRKVDDNHYYAVYKIQQGGYFYVHFQRMLEEPDWAINNDFYNNSYYQGKFVATGYSYLTEKRSSADYAGIEVGDSIDKVIEIDGAAAFSKYLCEKRSEGCYSWQYLVDGALHLGFHRNEQGETVIDYKKFYPNSVVQHEPVGGDPGILANFSILPQDFPQ